MKSKIEEKLINLLSEQFKVKYEPKFLYGSEYKLKVDFELIDELNNIIYFEYSGMNFFKKYLKIIDVAKNNVNFYVIFDDENLKDELKKLNQNNLSELTLDKTSNRIETFYESYKRLLTDK